MMSTQDAREPAAGDAARGLTRREILGQGAATLGGVTALGVLLAACGGGDSSGGGTTSAEAAATSASTGAAETGAAAGSSVAEVDARLDAARAVPQFEPPGPAFDASAARGKTVFYLEIIGSIPIVQNLWRGVREASAAAGLEAIEFDGKGQPALYVQGFDQAIARNVDLIMVESIPSDSLVEPIRRAKEAGIPTLIINERSVQSGGYANPDVVAMVTYDYTGAAALEADWVVADSGGADINAVVFQFPGYPAHDDMTNKIRETFEQYATTDFKLHVEGVEAADWQTRLPVLTRSLMTNDPEINYMIPVVDGQSLFIVPALQQAGAADRVKISTFNATPAVMKLLADGNVVNADIGGPHVWHGWAYIDQALRILTDTEPVADELTPLRMFDTSNVAEIDLNAPEETWYDTDAAKAGYQELWGVA